MLLLHSDHHKRVQNTETFWGERKSNHDRKFAAKNKVFGEQKSASNSTFPSSMWNCYKMVSVPSGARVNGFPGSQGVAHMEDGIVWDVASFSLNVPASLNVQKFEGVWNVQVRKDHKK